MGGTGDGAVRALKARCQRAGRLFFGLSFTEASLGLLLVIFRFRLVHRRRVTASVSGTQRAHRVTPYPT